MDRDQLEQFVSNLADPQTRETIGEKGLLKNVAFCGGQARVTLLRPPVSEGMQEQLRRSVQHAVATQEGVTEVVVDYAQGVAAPAPQLTVIDSGAGQAGPAPGRPAPHRGVPPAQPIAGVKKILAVASGKGGVGKSTVAVNLALALTKMGARVGLMDADVYGPSIPMMLNLDGQPGVDAEQRILPLKSSYGVDVMSIGFLMEGDDTPVIWRGPMVMKLITQFLRNVAWRNLDFLVIDLPPGTGDVQLTLVQTVPVTGAVIVTTPQDIALLDAKKAFQMFRRVETPIVGIIENMSSFVWPGLEPAKEVLRELRGSLDSEAALKLDKLDAVLEEHALMYPFGKGGGRREAEKRNVPFLGGVPLDIEIRSAGDRGLPIVEVAPDSPASRVFMDIARHLLDADHDAVGHGKDEKKGFFSKMMGR